MSVDMTPTEQKWAARVQAWRASGMSARQFSEGCDFSAGALYYWAYRLKQSSATVRQSESNVRIARVQRVASPVAALIVEIGPARLHVTAQADHLTVQATISALMAAIASGEGR